MTPLLQSCRRAWSRLAAVVAKRRADRELAAEMAFHIEMQIEDNLRAGMSAEDAILAARLKFGNVEAVKESCRDQRGLPRLESIVADLRYAIRGWRRNPAFTLTAILALAIGIGATTAIFSLVDAELLKPLPFPDLDRLVILNTIYQDDGELGSNPIASPAMFAYWRKQSNILEDASAFTFEDGVMNYTGGQVVEQWDTSRVSASVFRCLGFRILRGRAFTADEELPNKPLVALLGEALWRQRFAGDLAILGKQVSLNGNPYAVIGIVADNPAMLEFGSLPQVYVPFQFDPNSTDQNQSFFVAAHLKPGVTLNQAKDRLRASSGEYRAKFPLFFGPKNSFSLMPFQEFLTGDMRGVLLVLLCAVSFVLLIACANVANLLLVRGAARRREMGIRAAIGAGRIRIVRQLLTESVLLSLAGGALGLCLGFGGIRALLAVNTADLHRVGDNGSALVLNWHLVGFVLAVSLVTTLLFGLLPALQSARADLNSVLKENGGQTGTGFRQNKARASLVVSEVGLAVLLLVGAALLIRTFTELYNVKRGFDTRNVLTMRVLLTGPKYATSVGVAETIRDSVERIRALPGVVNASATFAVPLQSENSIVLQMNSLTFDVVGRPPSDGTATQVAGWATVSPGFFEVFNIPVKRGRAFTWRDGAKSSPVVMINETLARQFWKDGDPLNDRLIIGRRIMTELKDEPVRQIIGIVGDVRDTGLDNVPRPVMYVPQAQVPDAYTARFFRDDFMAWVVRTRTRPGKLAPSIQEQLRKSTGLPVSGLLSMDDVVSLSTARQRFSMLLMSIFSCSALLLAAVGLYGLMAYTVEQRRQEIGIRLALGADAVEVKRLVVWQGMRLVLCGVGVGLIAAWSGSRVMESLLYGVQPRDPLAFVATPLVLIAVALLAVWLPAKQASRVDPAVALRYQ